LSWKVGSHSNMKITWLRSENGRYWYHRISNNTWETYDKYGTRKDTIIEDSAILRYISDDNCRLYVEPIFEQEWPKLFMVTEKSTKFVLPHCLLIQKSNNTCYVFPFSDGKAGETELDNYTQFNSLREITGVYKQHLLDAFKV
jgi:hypothetical protein